MLSFDIEMVQTALRLLENRSVSTGEAAALLDLVESREEFLAHLLLRRDSLSAHPDIVSAIRQVASNGGREPVTARQQHDDLELPRQAYFELEARLASLIADASRPDEIFSQAESAMRIFRTQIAPIGIRGLRFAAPQQR